jgi:exopolysaccharide biosynthesis polyprenyl glycosylphosphotransferase
VHSLFQRGLLVAMAVAIASLLMIAVFYLDMSSKLGRGIMAIGVPLALVLSLVHHWWIHAWSRNFRERIIFLLIRPEDEDELELFLSLNPRHLDFVGVVCQKPRMFLHRDDVLGSVEDLESVTRQQQISRCLVSNHAIYDEGVGCTLRHMRYSGISVVPLISLCEETEQFVPLELVTSDWLLHASGSPHMLYLRKVKRAVDIFTSLGMLALLSPILLAGVLAVRLTSRGPIFYRQIRCGRFGRDFEVIKLRTMRVDAEKSGAVWAQSNDPRVTPVGGFLRKYRIDEIPQLFNVLRGEMSFVGPRPERPEFMEELARQIPYFRERLLVQPGITGWAQVKYPYGSTVADAKHKLEFDLYYMKHMSPFLDLFIFLDTVRIILTGGLNETEKEARPFAEAARAYGDRRSKATRQQEAVAADLPNGQWTKVEEDAPVGFSTLSPAGSPAREG